MRPEGDLSVPELREVAGVGVVLGSRLACGCWLASRTDENGGRELILHPHSTTCRWYRAVIEEVRSTGKPLSYTMVEGRPTL